MKTSQRGIELIKKHEGLRLAAYLCPAGIPTIGYGHTKGVKLGQVITETEAEQFLIEDLKTSEQEIDSHNLRLNQNQFDALVSFVFNVGAGNFRSSTLLRRVRLNSNDNDIENQFKRWVYANGRVLPGLVKRRNDEAKLYFS
jgi:lysozyme